MYENFNVLDSAFNEKITFRNSSQMLNDAAFLRQNDHAFLMHCDLAEHYVMSSSNIDPKTGYRKYYYLSLPG
jgi:hypothetical protein